MKIYKRESGLVELDSFEELGAEWSTSSGALTSIADGLVIEHNETKDIRVLRDIPSGAGVFYFSIDYTPTEDGDQAGVVVYRNKNESVELLEYKNGNPEELTDVRITKRENEYTFEMLRGNEWEFVDSYEYPFNKIGFIAKKGLTTFKPLKVTQFLAVTSSVVKVQNLLSGFRVELVGEVTTEATAGTDGFAEVLVPKGMMVGSLKVYDELNVLISEVEGTFYGGDVWNLGSFLIMKKDGVELDNFDPTNLGRIVNNNLDAMLEVYNPASIDALGLVLKIKQFTKQGNGDIGWEWVDLAWDIDGVPGVYSKEISVDRVNSGTSAFYWVRIQKESAVPQNSNSIYFTIYLKHE